MKLGILTFQRVLNDGGVFQMFCLFKILQNIFPNDYIEIIDYLPQKTRKSRRVWNLSKKRIIKKNHLVNEIIKRHERFCKKNGLIFSKKIKVDDSLNRAIQEIQKQNYDVIFVGSDTVWDIRKNGGAPLPPNVYFLPNLKNVKKIAFAASMDKGRPNMISHDLWEQLIGYIKDFDYISVRDQETAKLLRLSNIEDKRITYMPDPTLIFDFKLKKSVKVDDFFSNKKIAGVAVSDDKMKKEATKQLFNLGYIVVNLLGRKIEKQITLPSNFTLEEKILSYSKLKFLITDRFHGSIFKLKQNQRFPILFIEPDYYYAGLWSKGRDLFERLEISKMVWRYKYNEEIPNNLIDMAINNWEKKFEEIILSNLDYLNKVGKNNIEEIKRLIEKIK